MNKSVPIILLVVVLIVAGSSFAWFLITPGGSSITPQGTYNQTKVIVLWANAQGWNFNTTPNPVLNERLHTLLEFKVIEQDGLPHTLTINPGPNESTSNDIVNVPIPTTIGSVTWVNWSFESPGLYTYWCEVHPETMVGKLYVNSTSNSTSTSNNSTAQLPMNPSLTSLSLNYQSSYFLETKDGHEQIW